MPLDADPHANGTIGTNPSDGSPDRTGVLAGVAAYGLWGLFPLLFHQLRGVGAFEILLHRVLWSLVVVLALLRWRRQRGWLQAALDQPRQVVRLAVAGILLAVNWLTYIWAVNHDHVVEAALGYYINPLLTVALGVAVLGERLRRHQVMALALGAAAVVVLTAAYGRPPWIALVLAVSSPATGSRSRRSRWGRHRRWPSRPPCWRPSLSAR